MSTVKATNFQHPSASAAGITLGSDGSVVLPSGFTGGLGTNVVQTVKTDTFSASVSAGNTTSVTGLTVTITPTSATSKVLVTFSITGTATNVQSLIPILTRGGSAISVGDAAGSRKRVTSASVTEADSTNQAITSITASFLDSPATTSATTYGVDLYNYSSITRTLTVNRSLGDLDSAVAPGRSVSSITAIEVAA